eukprot:COSAG03_NODE_2126_length_3097_cov_4.711474_1_plen_121_part_00
MVLLGVTQTGTAQRFVPSSCLTATFGSRPFTVGIESLIRSYIPVGIGVVAPCLRRHVYLISNTALLCDITTRNVSHRIALSLPVSTLKVTRVRHVVPLAIGSLRITTPLQVLSFVLTLVD